MKQLLLSLTIYFSLATTQGQITFEKTFSIIGSDYGESVQQTNDGGYIVTGYSSSVNESIILLKVDSLGNKQWDKNLGDDEAYSVKQTLDSGYIVAGRVWVNGVLDALVIKTDINGDTIWKKTYGGIETDDAYSIYAMNNNTYIIGGRTHFAGNYKMYVIKIDSSGNEIWSKSFGGGSGDKVYSVQQTSDGGFILAGIVTIGGNIYNLIKTDNVGNLEWYNTQGGGYGANSVYQLHDDGYILTISQESGANLVRTDNTGNIIWNKFYSCGGYCSLNFGIQISDSGLVAIGSSGPNFSSTQDVFLLKTNINGDTIWTKKFGGTGNEQGMEVWETNDGGFILVGRSGGSIYLIKTNDNGDVIAGNPCNTLSSQTTTACDSYLWNGNTYTVSGTYTDTIPNASGCDSIMTLNLTINIVDTSVTISPSVLTANATGAIYQWLSCNNNFSIITGETNQTFTPSLSGNYSVFVTQNNCTDTSYCYNITITGINENIVDIFSNIFPNPFFEQTTLRTGKILMNATLKVYDSFGQTVKQIRNISGQSVILQRDNLPSGLYFIRLTQESKIILTDKLVITD